MRKRWYFNFLRKTEVERSGMQEPEVGEEVECWAPWRRLIYCKPMEEFQNRSYIMQFWSSYDGTGSRVESKLETINLSSRKIEQKRVAVSILERMRDVAIVEAVVRSIQLRIRRWSRILRKHDLEIDEMCWEKRKIFIQDDTKVTSRVNRCMSDIVW